MNNSINNILEKLNEEQIKPVLDTDGYVLVIAGAGSGKTRVLTSRIAYLVLEKEVKPSEILAITFTNKAAKEMKERLSQMFDGVDYMWCSTIHSMCVRILRSCIERLGYTKDFTIYDDSDKEKVVKRICQDMGLESDKYVKPAKEYISIAKNNYQTPGEFAKDNTTLTNIDIYYQIMLRYEDTLYSSNSLDFDDLLVKTVEVFQKYPEVKDYYARKFTYIHIDEFQDTNRVQFLIVRLLASANHNLFAVGDDDQSIYGWRGADIDNILSFDKIFLDTKVYKLEQNYRSTKKVLDLANKIIDNNENRRKKVLWTENDNGDDIVFYDAVDERAEASYVALQIKTLMARHNYDYKDFAILVRLNALSRGFEQEFLKYALPYKIFGGFKFYERKEVKDVLGYLKLINNPVDNEAFLRIINCPKRGIGEKTVNALLSYGAENGCSLYDTLVRLEFVQDINAGARAKLESFRRLIFSLQEMVTDKPFDEFIKDVIEKVDFKSMYSEDTEENKNRLMNIDEFVNGAIEFRKDNYEATLSDFLNSITLSSDIDEIDEDNSVVIATIHAVKGLEYKCVFICGLEEGIFPISRASGDIDSEEEERRLMYVSITRARERLFLTKTASRYLHGERKFSSPSRYLKECGVIKPKKPVEKSQDDGEGRRFIPYDDEPVYSNVGYSSSYAKTHVQNIKKQNEKQNSIDYQKFRAGAKVKHPKFGNGTILVVQGNGPSMVADIAFKDFGIKKLAVKFAPLEIV